MKSHIIAVLLFTTASYAAETKLGLRNPSEFANNEQVDAFLDSQAALLQVCATRLTSSYAPEHFAAVRERMTIRLAAEGGDEAKNEKYLEQVIKAFFTTRAQFRAQKHQRLVDALQQKASETTNTKLKVQLEATVKSEKDKMADTSDPQLAILKQANKPMEGDR